MTAYTKVGNIGEEIRLNITDTNGSPVTTSATLTQYKVVKGDGTSATWTATVYDTNNLTYLTVAGDLNVSGHYLITPYVEWGASTKLYGNAFDLFVHPQSD